MTKEHTMINQTDAELGTFPTCYLSRHSDRDPEVRVDTAAVVEAALNAARAIYADDPIPLDFTGQYAQRVIRITHKLATPWVPRNPRRIDEPAQVTEILELAA